MLHFIECMDGLDRSGAFLHRDPSFDKILAAHAAYPRVLLALLSDDLCLGHCAAYDVQK